MLSPGTGPASWDTQHSLPCPLSPSVCWYPALHRPSAPFVQVGWGGTGGVLLQGLNLLSVFCSPALSWSPSPCPTFQSQRWMPCLRMIRHQVPQVRAWWEDPLVWGRLCEDWCDECCTLLLMFWKQNSHGSIFKTYFKKKNWKFPISSTHWVSLPRSKLKAFFPRYSLQAQGNTHQQSLMVGCHFFSSHFYVSGCILHIPFLLVCLEDCSIQTHGELLHSLQLCCITLYEKNDNLIAPYW